MTSPLMRRLVALEGERPVYWSVKDMPDKAFMDLIRPVLGDAPTDDEPRALAYGEAGCQA